MYADIFYNDIFNVDFSRLFIDWIFKNS